MAWSSACTHDGLVLPRPTRGGSSAADSGPGAVPADRALAPSVSRRYESVRDPPWRRSGCPVVSISRYDSAVA